ncbi:hypothetical protein FEM48_Zijuj01G0312900 [Ziziphus jujuba var. spinosa]|uniref:Uncharacterized protein n=1 Tax=Ziziphus jujuba var. spinosa TaxID=714518 RepID=A0A978W680_ZIZJJ|nr:hypothetical protein FEM48_Zijuj01G0312900 [Ziziphus jujuba var. spinosa]
MAEVENRRSKCMELERLERNYYMLDSNADQEWKYLYTKIGLYLIIQIIPAFLSILAKIHDPGRDNHPFKDFSTLTLDLAMLLDLAFTCFEIKAVSDKKIKVFKAYRVIWNGLGHGSCPLVGGYQCTIGWQIAEALKLVLVVRLALVIRMMCISIRFMLYNIETC